MFAVVDDGGIGSIWLANIGRNQGDDDALCFSPRRIVGSLIK
jgi:hypothetical protein